MKIFLAVYEILLLGCEFIFCIRLQCVWKRYQRLKKEYCLAPAEIRSGRGGRTRAGIAPFLRYAGLQLLSWLIIAAVCVYACADCIVWIFG